MVKLNIAGLGVCLPECRMTSLELERQLNLEAGWIERAAGVRERRYATTESAVGLAANAARSSGSSTCAI